MRGTLVLGCSACVACALVTDLDELRGDAGDASSDVFAMDDAGDASTQADAPMSDAPSEGESGGDSGIVFFDNFNRPDSNQIGNGWLTKMTAFDIGGDALQRVDPNPQISYLDNLVYRPAAENILNVRVSVEVRYQNFSNVPYPQIHERIDPTTAPVADELDSYLFFPTAGASTGMTIARQHGSAQEVVLSSFALNPTLDTSHAFRFTLSVTGTTSVTLAGEVEILTGASWVPIGSGSYVDTDATRIVKAGSVGLSGSNGEQAGDYDYDNFTVTAL